MSSFFHVVSLPVQFHSNLISFTETSTGMHHFSFCTLSLQKITSIYPRVVATLTFRMKANSCNSRFVIFSFLYMILLCSPFSQSLFCVYDVLGWSPSLKQITFLCWKLSYKRQIGGRSRRQKSKFLPNWRRNDALKKLLRLTIKGSSRLCA